MGHAVLVDSAKYHAGVEKSSHVLQVLGSSQYAVTHDTASVPITDDMVIDRQSFIDRQGNNRDFADNYASFSFLRSKGYYLMPGLRFGGVFVAYPGDPLQFHSHLIVRTVCNDEKINLLDLVSSGRLATAVKKAWVLIEKPKTESVSQEQGGTSPLPKAYSIEWAGFG